eukprot:ctg_3135.g612
MFPCRISARLGAVAGLQTTDARPVLHGRGNAPCQTQHLPRRGHGTEHISGQVVPRGVAEGVDAGSDRAAVRPGVCHRGVVRRVERQPGLTASAVFFAAAVAALGARDTGGGCGEAGGAVAVGLEPGAAAAGVGAGGRSTGRSGADMAAHMVRHGAGGGRGRWGVAAAGDGYDRLGCVAATECVPYGVRLGARGGGAAQMDTARGGQHCGVRRRLPVSADFAGVAGGAESAVVGERSRRAAADGPIPAQHRGGRLAGSRTCRCIQGGPAAAAVRGGPLAAGAHRRQGRAAHRQTVCPLPHHHHQPVHRRGGRGAPGAAADAGHLPQEQFGCAVRAELYPRGAAADRPAHPRRRPGRSDGVAGMS